MAVKLCTRADVVDWWGEPGTMAREDDDRSSVSEGGELARTDRLIEKASSVVISYLAGRYSVSEYGGAGTPPANTPMQVQHYTSVIAAYFLGIRRNLPTSAELAKEYERVIKQLEAIQSGSLPLGGIVDSFESLPTVSNFTTDGRNVSTKIRVVEATSTGKRPSPPTANPVENRLPSPLRE